MQGAQVRSLVRELRFRMLHGVAKKEKKNWKGWNKNIRDLPSKYSEKQLRVFAASKLRGSRVRGWALCRNADVLAGGRTLPLTDKYTWSSWPRAPKAGTFVEEKLSHKAPNSGSREMPGGALAGL